MWKHEWGDPSDQLAIWWDFGIQHEMIFSTYWCLKAPNRDIITIHIPASKFPDLATCINNQSQ